MTKMTALYCDNDVRDLQCFWCCEVVMKVFVIRATMVDDDDDDGIAKFERR